MINTIWGGVPCPNDCCPKPGIIRSWFYRTKPWVCPLCCYGWVRQNIPRNSTEVSHDWVRTSQPVPFYRPGKRRAQMLKPFK